MGDSKTLDRVAMAAHCLREVMEKLPECAGLTAFGVAGNAADVVKTIADDLEKLKVDSPAARNNWTGEIDIRMQEFILGVDGRLAQFREISKTRVSQARDTFRALDPTGRPLPEVHEDANLRAWNDLRKYFVNVAHHRFTILEEEFQIKIAEFEVMAGARIAPTPTDEADLIDRLIEEAERGDQH
jgi:hypothetical protein